MKEYLEQMKAYLFQIYLMEAFISYPINYNQSKLQGVQKRYYRTDLNPYSKKDKRNKEWEVPLN